MNGRYKTHDKKEMVCHDISMSFFYIGQHRSFSTYAHAAKSIVHLMCTCIISSDISLSRYIQFTLLKMNKFLLQDNKQTSNNRFIMEYTSTSPRPFLIYL